MGAVIDPFLPCDGVLSVQRSECSMSIGELSLVCCEALFFLRFVHSVASRLSGNFDGFQHGSFYLGVRVSRAMKEEKCRALKEVACTTYENMGKFSSVVLFETLPLDRLALTVLYFIPCRLNRWKRRRLCESATTSCACTP